MPCIETRDRVGLFHQDWGAGEAAVVFLSAWSLSSKMWQYQMITMVDRGVRCVAYDRRGHGRSDQPGAGYDYDSLADDLAELLDAIDLRGVTLVGHSMAAGEIVRISPGMATTASRRSPLSRRQDHSPCAQKTIREASIQPSSRRPERLGSRP